MRLRRLRGELRDLRDRIYLQHALRAVPEQLDALLARRRRMLTALSMLQRLVQRQCLLELLDRDIRRLPRRREQHLRADGRLLPGALLQSDEPHVLGLRNLRDRKKRRVPVTVDCFTRRHSRGLEDYFHFSCNVYGESCCRPLG